MNSITKNRSLVSIIIFLLITNIAMLVFFLVLNNPVQKNQHPKDQNGMSGVLQNEVGFTKGQVDSYLALRKNQMDTVHALFDQLRKSKMDFYNLIYSSQVSDSSLNKAADLIAERQKALDLQMFSHFKTVRNICTPDQLQKFDSTIKKVFIRMTGRTGRK
jgi:Spy/CpxP family protein refolding chaperone